MNRAKSIFIILFFTVSSFAQYSIQVAFPNMTFSLPVEMVNAGDGTNRIFVVTQKGKIYVFPNSPTASNPKIFLDISDSASQGGGEMGLLGLAFHPNYSNNRYFYVDYTTEASPLRSKISRFQTSASNPDSAVRNSELVLLTVVQPFTNHNGGHLAFGPDGYLYIAFGDGGSGGDPQNNAQNRSVLLGKILRIDVNPFSKNAVYSIPPTNPFYGNSQGWRQEIFAYGLRNPWKFSFDIPSGRIWAADVGQASWEEVDIIQSGKNYGWRIKEGFVCYNPPAGCDSAGLTSPIWTYYHSEGQSVTGGYVYRGPTVPSLTGKYVYADFASGRIWALTYNGINPAVNSLVYDSPIFISSFGVDQNNELYICEYGPSGKIYKINGAPIGNGNNGVPVSFELKQNYPNPFNPVTTIKFSLDKNTLVTLKIFDQLGRELQTLVSEFKNAGSYEVSWDASDYPSGIYFYRLSSGIRTAARTMALVK